MTVERLEAVLEGLDRVVIAFSGGVDSALLAHTAHRVLGPGRALAVTAVSDSLAPSERAAARAFAQAHGISWREVTTTEMDRPGYVANGIDRCYHCKSELMDQLVPVAAETGAAVVLGVNLDDLDDHRPGQHAARERGARFPLVEAGMTKEAVRSAARAAGLEVWDRPAAACLASRVPYGTPVTVGTLRSVGAAEEALLALGFSELRVRHYGDLARIEVPTADLPRLVEGHRAVIDAVKAAGYRYVTVDLEGLRSGNLNDGVVR